MRKRKRDEEELDVDVLATDDEPEHLPTLIGEPLDPSILADQEWLARDPDDDITVDFFPPVFMEEDIDGEGGDGY